MGFFDRIRKTDQQPAAGNSLFREIISVYGLRKAKPNEPSLEQDWWEGYYGTMRLAVQKFGEKMFVYIGDVVEVTEIYLGRINPEKPIPPDSPQRLDRIVGTAGSELASQFILLATPGGDFDYPQLRLPALRDGIPRLSYAVDEIAIYENFRGLFLVLRHPHNRAEFDNDLRIASEMVKALTLYAGQTS